MASIYEDKGFGKLYNVEGVTSVLIRDHYLIRKFSLTKNQKLDAEMGNITTAIDIKTFKVYLLRKFPDGDYFVMKQV